MVCSNAVLDIEFDEELRLLYSKWKDCTSPLSYISGIKSFREIFDKVHPKNTLWDIRKLDYAISDDLQKWTDDFLNVPAVQAGFAGKVSLITGKNMARIKRKAVFMEV